jgi:hypothetical protein
VQKFELCGAEAKIILLSANRGMLANFHLWCCLLHTGHVLLFC